jgi:hypothetical protein
LVFTPADLSIMTIRTFRAGSSVEDYCRACKTDRIHTVIVADEHGQPLRAQCGYCRSEHNYRGGPRVEAAGAGPDNSLRLARDGRSVERQPRVTASSAAAMDIVSTRERVSEPVMVTSESVDLELLLRRVIREEAGVSAVVPSEKWRNGTLVLKPGAEGLQEKSWPIETFFHKIVMLRNRLRTLEQQVNASDLPEDVKVKLQGYVSGCYGSLTSFNVLFADEGDQFKGSASD